MEVVAIFLLMLILILNTIDAEPQYNEQYEIGVKSNWLDQRLNTQLSVYDIRKKNIRYQPDAKEQPFLWSVGGEHQSKGLEFSFIGRVLDNCICPWWLWLYRC